MLQIKEVLSRDSYHISIWWWEISLRNRLTDTENKPVITRGEQGGRSGEIGEGD